VSVTTRAVAEPSRRLALGVLCAGQLMIIWDGTIVNVALPSIQGDLGFSSASLAWVVNAYLVPFGGLLLLFGRIGDLIPPRRVFTAGLAVFTAGSLACGLAQTPTELLAFRFVQGIGGAMASAVTLGMVVTLFSEPAGRARAIGIYSFVQSAGGTLGLAAGGALTQLLSWHWIFIVNVPIGAGTLLLAARALTGGQRADGAARPDAAGALLVTLGLTAAIVTIVETSTYGWGSAHTAASGAAAVALLGGFVARQARSASPLVPRRVLQSGMMTALLSQAFLIAGMFSFQFIVVLYLHEVLGLDDLRTGLAMLPVSLSIGATSLGAAPRLITGLGIRPVLAGGLALIIAGLALLSRVPVHGAYAVHVLPALITLGIGFGAAMPSLATLAMSAAGPADSGIASGLFNTVQQVGGALGLAVLSTLAATRTATLLNHGTGRLHALTSGYDAALAGAACSVAVALLLVVIGGLRARPRPADTSAPVSTSARQTHRAARRSPA
jgi:EmrB/QacA subfamily drug resistance transporter